MFSHTSYVHDQNNITYDMIVTPAMCTLASKSKKVNNTSFDGIFDGPFDMEVNPQSHLNDGQDVSSTIECASG